MQYVISDIHGMYDKYAAMLDTVGFGDDDVLYVCGDVLDRGPEPVRVLRDMALRPNVYPIMGNHELMALSVLRNVCVDITADNCDGGLDEGVLHRLHDWQQEGGHTTLEGFRALPPDARADLIEYLCDFAPYEVTSAGGRTFILVHSGLGNFRPDKKLSQYTLEELAFCRPDYADYLFDDRSVYVVAGHTPTRLIHGKDAVYTHCNNVCIDCGAVFGGKLACLRLDDMAEFYV